MTRGGIKPRADGSLAHLIQPTWKTGETKTIRVPIALADQLMAIARQLDNGDFVLSQDNPKQLKQALAILQEALKLKPNAGGAIEAEIKKALEVLNDESLRN